VGVIAHRSDQHVGQFLFLTCSAAVARRRKGSRMEAIIERAAGLDVHQATVVAGVLIGKAGGKPRKEVRTFGMMTGDLEALRDWLRGFGVTHVGWRVRAHTGCRSIPSSPGILR
jgi:hypothetical protein